MDKQIQSSDPPNSQAKCWLEREPRNLLALVTLPLRDGFFLTNFASGLGNDLSNALAFGSIAFSGPACIIAAMQLKGSALQRISVLSLIYIVVGVVAFAESMAQPVFASFLPPNLHLFSGVFLLGLALWTSGIPILRRIAGWLGFEAISKTMVAIGLIFALRNGLGWGCSFDFRYLPNLLMALGTGYLFSLVAGIGSGLMADKVKNQHPLRWSGSVSLFLTSLNVLGIANIPTIWVVTPLSAGCLWITLPLVLHSLLKMYTLCTHKVYKP
jgi:hypothetical protein